MRVSAVLASIEHYLEAILVSKTSDQLQQIDVQAVLGAMQIVDFYCPTKAESTPDKEVEAPLHALAVNQIEDISTPALPISKQALRSQQAQSVASQAEGAAVHRSASNQAVAVYSKPKQPLTSQHSPAPASSVHSPEEYMHEAISKMVRQAFAADLDSSCKPWLYCMQIFLQFPRQHPCYVSGGLNARHSDVRRISECLLSDAGSW